MFALKTILFLSVVSSVAVPFRYFTKWVYSLDVEKINKKMSRAELEYLTKNIAIHALTALNICVIFLCIAAIAYKYLQ